MRAAIGYARQLPPLLTKIATQSKPAARILARFKPFNRRPSAKSIKRFRTLVSSGRLPRKLKAFFATVGFDKRDIRRLATESKGFTGPGRPKTLAAAIGGKKALEVHRLAAASLRLYINLDEVVASVEVEVNYRRTFPPDLDGGGPPGDYIRPREFVDPDEDEIIARVAAAFVNDTKRLPANAGKDDPTFHEPHWGHSTGLLRGTLEIDAVDALPERFRVGLFAGTESYPVVCRPNFIKDRKLRLAAGRIAIKLAYPAPVPNVDAPSGEAHELDLLMVEGSPEVNGPGHVFFTRDARTLAMLGTVVPPSRESPRTLLTPRYWPLFAGFAKQVRRAMSFAGRPPATTTGWAARPTTRSGRSRWARAR